MYRIGNEEIESSRTTPESLELFEIFAKMAESGGEYVVMEVSSHSLVLDRVYGVEFETAVITNITQDHLDFHKTMDEYAKAKAIITEHESVLHKCAELLLEKEKIGQEEFEALFEA